MSTLANPPLDRAIYPTGPVYRLTVENYHDMIAAGILTTEDRVELLEGALICKMGQNPAHRTAVIKLQQALLALVPAGMFAQFQGPITLDGSEPEPDGAIIKGQVGQFADRNPAPSDVAIVVEISDTTLRQDRLIKKLLYAEAGIQTYWVVNLVGRQIEVMSEPSPADGDFKSKAIFNPGQRVPVIIDGQVLGEIPVENLLP